MTKKDLAALRETIKTDLLAQLATNGKTERYYIDMVEDYMALWDIAKALIKDINLRGVNVKCELSDGRIKTSKNESIGELHKTNGQMLKVLEFLELNTSQEVEEDDEL